MIPLRWARLAGLMREIPESRRPKPPGRTKPSSTCNAWARTCVILDIHMPGKNGLEILPLLKATAARPTVVVLTSHPTELHRRQCLTLGADYFFDKSRDFAQVVDIVVRPTLPARSSDP